MALQKIKILVKKEENIIWTDLRNAAESTLLNPYAIFFSDLQANLDTYGKLIAKRSVSNAHKKKLIDIKKLANEINQENPDFPAKMQELIQQLKELKFSYFIRKSYLRKLTETAITNYDQLHLINNQIHLAALKMNLTSRTENNSLTKEKKELEAKLAEAEVANKRYEGLYNTSIADNAQFNNTYQEISANFNKLREEHTELKKLFDELKKTHQETQATLVKTKTALQVSEEQCDALYDEKEAMPGLDADLKDRFLEQQELNFKLQQELKRFDVLDAVPYQELKALKETLRINAEKTTLLKQEILELKTKNRALEKKCNDFEQNIAELNENHEKYKTNVATIIRKLKSFIKKFKYRITEINYETAEVKVLEIEEDTLKTPKDKKPERSITDFFKSTVASVISFPVVTLSNSQSNTTPQNRS